MKLKPIYSLYLGNGKFWANDNGHKYTHRTCNTRHWCEGCNDWIEPGQEEIEHNFLMNGHWCTEYYHEGHL